MSRWMGGSVHSERHPKPQAYADKNPVPGVAFLTHLLGRLCLPLLQRNPAYTQCGGQTRPFRTTKPLIVANIRFAQTSTLP